MTWTLSSLLPFRKKPATPRMAGLPPDQHIILNRSDYKRVWNRVSNTEDDAKMAVSGFVDEEAYRTSGVGTQKMLSTLVGISSDETVLEIGAGVGRVGAALAPICKEWIATDVSENMLRHARKRLSRFANVRFVPTNGYDLAGIDDASVDVVYSTVVFMHLEEWDRFNYIKEGFRILRPGGRMLVDNINLLSDDGWKLFLEHCAIAPGQRPAQISKTSTPQELETYFQRAGFRDVKQFYKALWVFTYGTKS